MSDERVLPLPEDEDEAGRRELEAQHLRFAALDAEARQALEDLAEAVRRPGVGRGLEHVAAVWALSSRVVGLFGLQDRE